MRLTEFTQQKTHEMVEGPHLLFIGANGHKTYGITVRSLAPRSEVEDAGYTRQWSINDKTLARAKPEQLAFLGLSVEEAQELMNTVAQMSATQE